jgi:HEAT repeat protein
MTSKSKNRAAQPTASSRGFDNELATLEALALELRAAHAANAEQVEFLRKVLAHRNNFLVSKAARLAGDLELAQLLPDILTAFDRFFIDPVKTDPKCWAKEALAKALVKLGHRSKGEYLRGMRHHQLEPVMGGKADSAAVLRGTCAHALVDCPGISDADLLTALLEPLTDDDKTVRMEAARAIGNVGGVSAMLLMRLRAMQGNDQPEALGAVYSALLSLEGAAAVPLVAKALEAGDEAAGEAAFALAELRSAEALAALLARLRDSADPWFTTVLLSAIALTRLPEAVDFLLAKIAGDNRDAADAIEAIARIAPGDELRARITEAVDQADSLRLRNALRKHLPPIPD